MVVLHLRKLGKFGPIIIMHPAGNEVLSSGQPLLCQTIRLSGINQLTPTSTRAYFPTTETLNSVLGKKAEGGVDYPAILCAGRGFKRGDRVSTSRLGRASTRW